MYVLQDWTLRKPLLTNKTTNLSNPGDQSILNHSAGAPNHSCNYHDIRIQYLGMFVPYGPYGKLKQMLNHLTYV